jgi:NAD(P)-dependent dehydrogenase (short-subunit alcohol dehydrogenase family)
MDDLSTQAAVITGGGSGIGLAIAGALAREGMAVMITGRSDGKLQHAREKLRGLRGRVCSLAGDVADARHVQHLIDHTLESFGRIDLLVNNAGIGRRDEHRSIAEASEAEWDRMLAINLKSAFLCTKAVLPAMTRQGSGYVINIASRAGRHSIRGAAPYSAAKAGMIALTQNLILEASSHNIRGTAICPGYVATPMVGDVAVPREDMIPPDDIGGLVLALLRLSPAAVIKEIVIERKATFVA